MYSISIDYRYRLNIGCQPVINSINRYSMSLNTICDILKRTIIYKSVSPSQAVVKCTTIGMCTSFLIVTPSPSQAVVKCTTIGMCTSFLIVTPSPSQSVVKCTTSGMCTYCLTVKPSPSQSVVKCTTSGMYTYSMPATAPPPMYPATYSYKYQLILIFNFL